MAKIARYSGNLQPFAVNSTGTKRTIFGDTTQADDLDSNINVDFLKGWEIIDATTDFPTIQDTNAMGFTLGQLIAYLHQVGVPEWNAAQEYHTNSFVNRSGVIYKCLTNTHVSATAPESDATNWIALPASGISYDNSTSGLTAGTVQAAIDEVEARTEQATTTASGVVELATAAEAQALADLTRVITPATLALALQGANQSLAASGYQKLPGGLIIQWGFPSFTTGGTAVTFPIAFPSACRSVTATTANTGVYAGVGNVTAAGFVGYNSAGTNGTYWTAVGY